MPISDESVELERPAIGTAISSLVGHTPAVVGT